MWLHSSEWFSQLALMTAAHKIIKTLIVSTVSQHNMQVTYQWSNEDIIHYQLISDCLGIMGEGGNRNLKWKNTHLLLLFVDEPCRLHTVYFSEACYAHITFPYNTKSLNLLHLYHPPLSISVLSTINHVLLSHISVRYIKIELCTIRKLIYICVCKTICSNL